MPPSFLQPQRPRWALSLLFLCVLDPPFKNWGRSPPPPPTFKESTIGLSQTKPLLLTIHPHTPHTHCKRFCDTVSMNLSQWHLLQYYTPYTLQEILWHSIYEPKSVTFAAVYSLSTQKIYVTWFSVQCFLHLKKFKYVFTSPK